MSWSATDAKQKFASLLDTARDEGPQLIRRRGVSFVVVTEEELERRFAEGKNRKCDKFLSAWDALRLPPYARLTEEESVAFDEALASFRKQRRYTTNRQI
jgi:prevent-host-death family protein